jgi:hypothetical protein
MLYRRLNQGIPAYISYFFKPKKFNLDITFDTNKLNEQIDYVASLVDKPFVPTEINYKNGLVSITKGSIGVQLNKDSFINTLTTSLISGNFNQEINLATENVGFIPTNDQINEAKQKAGSSERKDEIYTPRMATVKKLKDTMTYIKYHMTQEGSDAVMVDDKIYNFGMNIQKIYENISHQIDAYGHRTVALDEHSFDCKFASHVFRLIQEGVDLLTKGELAFPCANAAFQLEVKQGKYDLDTILAKIEEMEPLLEKANLESTLQHAPMQNEISSLQTKLILDYWRDKKYI